MNDSVEKITVIQNAVKYWQHDLHGFILATLLHINVV